MPIKLNSKPSNGSTAKNPPNPKRLSKPIAQEGQAGATKLAKMLDELASKVPDTCLLTKNMVIAVTNAARTDITIKNMIDKAVIDVNVPLSREKSNEKEKSEKSIR